MRIRWRPGTGFYLPRLFEDTLGLKFTIITGYQGGGPIDLAVERGEIQCRAMTIESYLAREPFHTWRKTNFVKSIIQTPQKRDPRLPDTPTIYELMDQYKTPEQGRRVAAVILANGVFGRPMIGDSGHSRRSTQDSAQRLYERDQSPALVAEAEKRGYEMDPVPGDKLESLAKEVMSQPPPVIERMKKILEP